MAGVNAVHLQDDASPVPLAVSPAGSRMWPATGTGISTTPYYHDSYLLACLYTTVVRARLPLETGGQTRIQKCHNVRCLWSHSPQCTCLLTTTYSGTHVCIDGESGCESLQLGYVGQSLAYFWIWVFVELDSSLCLLLHTVSLRLAHGIPSYTVYRIY